MVRILLCRVNSSRSDVDARKEPSSENLIPCSSLPGTMADHYHEMIWSKPRCAPPLLLSLLVVLLLIVGPKAMNSVAATIVCMKLLGRGFSFRPAYLAQLLPFAPCRYESSIPVPQIVQFSCPCFPVQQKHLPFLHSWVRMYMSASFH